MWKINDQLKLLFDREERKELNIEELFFLNIIKLNQ